MMCGPERPDVSDGIISCLLREQYGVQVVAVDRLAGHDDFSAIIKYKDVKETRVVEKGVLKILGSDGSSNANYQHFIGSLLNFLTEEKIPVSSPIRTCEGTFLPACIQLVHPGRRGCLGHFVHVLRYIEGKVLENVKYNVSHQFIQELGAVVARLHDAVRRYPGQLPPKRPSPWYLVDAHLLYGPLGEVELKEEDRSLVCKAVDDFTSFLTNHSSLLTSCLLHGDLNEANIVVREDDSQHTIKLAGLIDFADMVEGPVIVDLAILALSLTQLQQSNDADLLHVCRQLLIGYGSDLNDKDMELCYLALPARCAQLIVMSLYDSSRDPSNSAYIMSLFDEYLSTLHNFYSTYGDKDEFTASLLNK